MTILRGKTQQFREILKSSYLGNGNKSKQNVWEFHRYEEYLNLGKFPYYGQCNTYIGVRVKNCNYAAKQITVSTI